MIKKKLQSVILYWYTTHLAAAAVAFVSSKFISANTACFAAGMFSYDFSTKEFTLFSIPQSRYIQLLLHTLFYTKEDGVMKTWRTKKIVRTTLHIQMQQTLSLNIPLVYTRLSDSNI